MHTAIYPHISDAMLTDMKTLNSIYDDNYSNWATTINPSSSYANEAYPCERPMVPTDHLLFDPLIDCYRQDIELSNKNTVEYTQTRSDPKLQRHTRPLASRSATTTTTTMKRAVARKNRNFTCTHCPFSSTWLYDLKIHLRLKHKIMDIP